MSDEAGETLIKLLDVFDDHDDVQNVYANYELSETLMESVVGGLRVGVNKPACRGHWRTCTGDSAP